MNALLKRQEAIEEAGGEGFRLDRIVLPMSQLGGWAMILVSILTSLHVLGINIQPLLAVGGVSGIAIGFGAQTVTANAIAGVNLVSPLPHPFTSFLFLYFSTLSHRTCMTRQPHLIHLSFHVLMQWIGFARASLTHTDWSVWLFSRFEHPSTSDGRRTYLDKPSK